MEYAFEVTFKVTINPNVRPEHYPLPNAEDMFASLNGGKVSSKIDLTHAYQQLEINKASKQYLTINIIFRGHCMIQIV